MIHATDAFEKLVEVEGEQYRRWQTEDSFGPCSFESFLKEWNSKNAGDPAFKTYRPVFGIDVKNIGAMYGYGGWNRYVVLNSGEIMFHRFAARSASYIQKAKEVGFRIFPDDLDI